MKILVAYRGIPQSPGWATGDMVVKAFRKLGHEVTPYGNYYQTDRTIEDVDPVKSIREAEYDLALYMECNDADPGYGAFKLVKARKTACWLFDTSYYADNLTSFNSFFGFDAQFIANPLDVDKFPNAYYLPYAADKDLHCRDLETEKLHDFSLVGSIREDRQALAKSLASANIDLKLIGGKFREEYIDALASSKVIINQNPPQGAGLLNMRFWEGMAAGSIVMTELRDVQANPILQTYPLSFVGYTPENLVDQCRFLTIPTFEEKMFRNVGQSNFLRHHLYEHRCEAMLKVLFPHG